FGIDYTINKKHSISADISLDKGDNESNMDFKTSQFAFETLTNQQFNTNNSDSHSDAFTLDLGYRYDIGDKGMRLDFASSYSENESDNTNLNENELIDSVDGTTVFSNNRDSQNQDNAQFSSRLDYTIPLKDRKGKFEAGIKYDDLTITDVNLFENFNTGNGAFEIDPNFTNAFEYNEQLFS
ncbi:unnamed protein product, partial [Ectocarpus sp. 12 AP-2014]